MELNRNKIILIKRITEFIGSIGAIFLVSWLVQEFWNIIMPYIFSTLPIITYKQAICVYLLCRMLLYSPSDALLQSKLTETLNDYLDNKEQL